MDRLSCLHLLSILFSLSPEMVSLLAQSCLNSLSSWEWPWVPYSPCRMGVHPYTQPQMPLSTFSLLCLYPDVRLLYQIQIILYSKNLHSGYTFLHSQCVVLWVRMCLIDWVFEHLVPRCWCCLENWYSLVEGSMLLEGSRYKSLETTFFQLSLFVVQDVSSHVTMPSASLLCHDDLLSLWKCKHK